MGKITKSLVFFVLMVAALHSAAQPVPIDKGFSHVSIGRYLYYWEDKAREVEGADILEKAPTLHFQNNDNDAINIGAVQSPYWFRFEVKNDTRRRRRLILEVQSPVMNKVQLVQQKVDTTLVSEVTGDHFHKSTRSGFSRHFAFPITLQPSEKITCFLWLDQNKETMRTFVSIWDEQHYWEKEIKEGLIHGSFFGICAFIIVVAAVFFIAFRKITFLFYFAYFIFLLIGALAFSGYGFIYLYPENIKLQQTLYLQAMGISSALFTLFALTYIKEILNMDRWKWVFYSYAGLVGVAILYGFFYVDVINRNQAATPVLISYLLSSANYTLLSYFLLLAFWRKKSTILLLIFLSSFLGLFGSIIMSLTTMGLMPMTYFASEVSFIWSVLEVAFVTAIMFFTARKMYQEKLDLETSLYVEKRRTLTEFVKGQHLERQRLSQELHDGISLNLANIKAHLSNFQLNLGQPEKQKDMTPILKLVGQTAADVRNFSHALGSVTLKNFGIEAAIEDLIVTMQSAYPDLQINHDLAGFSSKKMDDETALYLFQILQELLNNVHKHAQASKVLVRLSNKRGNLELVVMDNGKGYDPEDTASKGMGLQSIRSRALLLEGTFVALRNQNGGMKHVIVLPSKREEASPKIKST